MYRQEDGASPKSKQQGAQINTSILSTRSKAQEDSQKMVSFQEDEFQTANQDAIAKLYEKMKISSPQIRQSEFKITSIQSGRPDISPSNPSQWSVNQRQELPSEFAQTTPFQLMIQRMKETPLKTVSQSQKSESVPSVQSPTRIHRIDLPGTTSQEKAKFLQKEQESFDKDYNELQDLNNSYVIGEENLSEIATLLSTARQKNQVLKNTLTLLRKHNYLLDKQNKILKKRVTQNELLNSKLQAQLKLREQELIGLQAEVERREKRMKDVLKSIQEQNNHQNQQNAAKLDALVAQVDSKNRRIKDYKREAQALKAELQALKDQQEDLLKTISLSESLRVGMNAVINDRRKDFKVFCRVHQELKSQIFEFKFPQFSLGVSPSEIHVLNILKKSKSQEEQEQREFKFYFDGLFPQSTSQKEIFMKTKELTKGIARGDQVCFILLNSALDQTTQQIETNSLVALTFDFLQSQCKALSNLGNKMKILC